MSGGSIDQHICTYDDDDDNDHPDDDSLGGPRPKQWLPLYKNTTIVQQPVNVHALAETYVQEAKMFLQQQILTDTPYFLYMAFSHVHQLCASYTQIEQTTCQWSGGHHTYDSNASQHPTFNDAVQEMDWMVGQILDTIRHDPIQLHNTIIIFTSDNGPWLAEQSCSGLRGPYHAQWYVNRKFYFL
jgi:arylsulfatase A-like enzyme